MVSKISLLTIVPGVYFIGSAFLYLFFITKTIQILFKQLKSFFTSMMLMIWPITFQPFSEGIPKFLKMIY